MKKKLLQISVIAAFFTMLFLSSATKQGALNGLRLWLFTIVPTLLPFMLISSILIETESYKIITHALGSIMKPVFKLPYEAAYPFLMGMLCGFPMGSKITADMVKSGKLSVKDGNALLTFCNNISPPFIISYMTFYVLGLNKSDGMPIIFIMLISPVITGIITSRMLHLISLKALTDEKALKYQGDSFHENGFSIDRCILSGFLNITKLGGYIIIFSIICSFTSLIISNEYICASISGFFEITSGLAAFAPFKLSPQKIYMVCILSAFGGICTIAQTKSMIKGSGLSIRLYVFGKLVCCLVTIVLLKLAVK